MARSTSEVTLWNHNALATLSRTVGITSVTQYSIIIVAEIVVQTACGTPISAVDTFNTTVNNTIHTAVESTIISGLYILVVVSDHHKITGNTGNTQGANTLNIPAKNDIRKSDMGQAMKD